MHLGVYGSGYLATVMSACLADFGLPVTCFDEDAAAIGALAEGKMPFHERNLQEVVRRNARAGRLLYSWELTSVPARAQIIFLACDSEQGIEELARKLGKLMNPSAVLAIVTPVQVGTADRIEGQLRGAGVKVTVVSHPVFLTPGCAVEDFNWPDRILLGTGVNDAVLLFKQVYRPLVMRGVPIIVTTRATAELARQAASAFIATKISFINEVAAICEHVKADATDLSLALGLDKRIGPRCLQPGTSMGGAFGSGDMDAIEQLAGRCGVSLKVLGAAREVNKDVCERLADKISAAVDTLPGKQVAMLGLAFKPNTNCVRGSSSMMLVRSLLDRGAQVRAYDPAALADAKRVLNGSVHYCDSAYSAVEGGDAMVVATGWPEFRALDWAKIKKLLKRPVIVDTKNLLDSEPLRSMGFRYVGVGR